MTQPQSVTGTGSPKRKIRIRWLRIFVAVLVLLVVTEIVLRVVFGFGNPVLTMRDPTCNYRVRPDQHVYRLFSHNDINHYGMRSPEIELPRPKDRLRFFFIGDSVTYGTTYVDQPEIFTSRLAKLLPGVEHQPVEVLNQSAGGWGPGNEVGYFLANGAYDSNVVVFVLNTGDLWEGLAAFPESDLNYPTSRPWTAIGEVIQRYIIPRIEGKIFRDAGTTIPDPAELEEAQRKNFQLFSQAKDFAQRSHALFVIAYVPFAGFEKTIIEKPEGALAKWTAEEGVVFLDIAPALAKEDPKLTTVDGLHLRSRGDEVVAEEIAKQWPKVDAALKAMENEPATATRSRQSSKRIR